MAKDKFEVPLRKLIFIALLFPIFFGVLLFLPSENPTTQTNTSRKICLNMIVKNESAVIETCLNSVKGLIDYWVIVDTGSTDGTQSLIKNCLKDIPGELHERPWVNFEHNRNEALELAKTKAAYSLFMDADEILVFSDHFQLPALDKDIYSICLKQKGASDSVKWFMIKNALTWKWEGVLHETIKSPEAKTEELVQGVLNYSDTSLGARSKDPKKYLHDAEVLERELQKDPTNTRYQFYLASSYLNANELKLALKHYIKRSEMEGERGEVFISLLLKARLEEYFQESPKKILDSYQKAHLHTPSRAEPLFYLGLYHLNNQEYTLAYEALKKAPQNINASYIFFTENDVYEWRLPYFLAKACLHLQKYPEMKTALEKVLTGNNVPQEVLAETKKNLSVLCQNP